MLVLTLIPQMWRRVMEPRVLDFYGGDRRLAALQPERSYGAARLISVSK